MRPLYAAVQALASSHFVVRGQSMTPAFRPGERLLVSRLAYRLQSPARGDVVVVRDPREPRRMYLKRLIALPGEEVHIVDGSLYVNGTHLEEPYVQDQPASLGLGEGWWVLGTEECFVMGDNRAHSTDSRQFGAVGKRLLVGRAWFRYWPLEVWGAVSPQRPPGLRSG